MSTAPEQVTDPVCHMRVDPQSAAASAEHEGTTYYFCSTHCEAAFRKDPAAYVES